MEGQDGGGGRSRMLKKERMSKKEEKGGLGTEAIKGIALEGFEARGQGRHTH